MPKTLAEWLGGRLLDWRLKSRVRPRRTPRRTEPPIPIPATRRPEMTLPFLDGYKTYIVAAAMILAGLSQLIGVDLPSFEGQAAGHLLMEGLAIIFLRKGMKAN
jgi:hypothetical protein